MAWWTTWKVKVSGRSWVIAASVTSILWSVALPTLSKGPQIVKTYRDLVSPVWGGVAYGLAGLALFWSRHSWAQAVAEAAETPGDPAELPPDTS